MIAMRCERCGGSYEISGNIWSKVGLAAYELNECVSWEEFDDYRDLCPECMKDFERWRKGASGVESGPAGWISVKDRLPEEDVPVLACYIGAADSIKEGEYCTDGIANYHNGAWYWWEAYGEDNDEPVKVKITHWMPLPEPPGDSDAQA